MIALVILALLGLAVGFPLAVLLARDEEPRWASLAAEGVLLGLGWYLALGLAAARLGLLGRPGILVPSAALAGWAWTKAGPVVRMWPRPRPTWFGGAMAGVFLAGAFLRRDAFYFLFQTADFGEYVNRANVLAAGGPFHDWFLPLYSVALGLSNVAFGPAGTVDIVPFLGLVMAATVVAIGQRLGFGRIVLLATAAVLVAEPVAVWFSRFPASETLYAVLLGAFVVFAVLAVQRGRPAEVGVAAAFAGLMMLTRPNAVLLGLVLLITLVVGAFVLRRPALQQVAAVVGASTLALYAGFVYNARNSAAYFVDTQLQAFTPGPLFSVVDDLHRPLPALTGLVAMVAGLLVVLAAALAVNRAVGPPRQGPARWARVAVLPLVAAGMAGALAVAFGLAGLADAVSRYGWLLLGLAAVGTSAVLATVVRRSDDAGRLVGVLVVVIGGSFALLFAHRLPEAHPAPYYLYWDRYLFSEVFPAMALAVLWGVAAVAAAGRRLARGRVPAALVAGSVAVALGAAGAQAQPRLDLQREQVLFDGAYRQLAELDELASPAGLPVVYSGMASAELPDGWLHTNTYRVVALPLQQTFGRRVLNIAGVHPFGPDPRPDDADVVDILRAAGASQAILVEVARGSVSDPGPLAFATSTNPRLERSPLGALAIDIPLLPRRLDPGDEAWRVLTMDLEVWLVELAPSPPAPILGDRGG